MLLSLAMSFLLWKNWKVIWGNVDVKQGTQKKPVYLPQYCAHKICRALGHLTDNGLEGKDIGAFKITVEAIQK